MKMWAAKNPERRKFLDRRSHLKRKYGISTEKYDEMLKSQAGVCAICAGPPDRKYFCVDHSHDYGSVRGLLCFNCNVLLGVIEKMSQSEVSRFEKYLADRNPINYG